MFQSNNFAYFSELSKAGELTFTPLGQVRKSQKKNSFTGADMWNVQVNLDGKTGYFCLDNHAMASQLAMYSGNQIKASFNRDGKQQLLKIIEAPEGINEEPQSPAAAAPKRQRLTVKQGLTQVTNALYAAHKYASQLRGQLEVDSLDSSHDIIQSIMIYLNNHGLVDLFPSDHQIWSPAQKAEAEAKQEAIEEEAKKIFKAKPAQEPVIKDLPQTIEGEPPCEKNEKGEFVF